MNRSVFVSALLALCSGATGTVHAQRLAPRRREFWITGAAVLAITIPLDERIREFAAQRHSPTLDGIATTVGDAGSPRFVLPVLLAGAAVPRLLGDAATSNAVIDIGLAYGTTSIAGMLAREMIGRHRPDSSGRIARFAPFHRGHEWHSFPSGHVLGVMSLATAIAIKADRPWATTLSFGLASLVGVQRLYEQKHWASDAVAGTIFGVAASAMTVRWRERHHSGRD